MGAIGWDARGTDAFPKKSDLQRKILPAAWKLLRSGGTALSLLKPHYEVDHGRTRRGVLAPDEAEEVADDICKRLGATGFPVERRIDSPIEGGKGNREFWLLLRKP